MADPFRIRSMTVDDLDTVIAIAKGLPDAPHWPRSGYEAVFTPNAYPPRIGLVAVSDWGEIPGFLIAAIIAPQAEIESIAVTSGFQRIGLGRQLVAHLSDELRRRNCSEILLEVRVSNHAARSLYSALGFTETARRPAYYSDPVEDAILMSRPAKQAS